MSVKIPGYEMVRPIAEGGMASVYLAVQESLGRYVAIKLLKKFDNPDQARRFQNEGHIIASLNHRNIITIYDIGVCDERHYISMEYLEGGDLEARILAGMSVEAALDLLEVMGSCLDFLHCKEIIHRDIKPANILFHKDGTPILTDFGVARQLEDDMRLTMEGSAVGSPHYLSPEQAECKPLDGRTDIYGLGIIFHEMLTGVKPYQGDSHIETILAHLTEPLPSLPPALERYQGLLERMIAKDPDERFATAGEMLEYIHKLRGRAASGLPAGLRGLSGGTRQRRLAAGAVVVFIAAAGLLIKLPSMLAGQTVNGPASSAMTASPALPAPDEPAAYDMNPPMVAAEQPVDGFPLAGNVETGGEEENTYTFTRQTSDDPSPLYAELLLQARQALDAYRLTIPKGDNAYYFYRSVLEEDPDHEEALAGVVRIAYIYASLAEQELDRFHYSKASAYIERGLAVDPDNARLRELERTNTFTDASRRALGKVKSLFQ